MYSLIFSIQCALVRVDAKTFRKWSWIFIVALSNLRLVSSPLHCNNFFVDLNNFRQFSMHASFNQTPVGACVLIVNGTDCRIFEPTPFNRRWYSHKFHGPGLSYELWIMLRTGKSAWVHGPFACGEWPDLKFLSLT